MFESMLGEVAVRIIFIDSLTYHLRPAFGTGTVEAALSNHVRFFVSTLGANTVAIWAGAGFITTALPSPPLTTSALTTAPLAASAA